MKSNGPRIDPWGTPVVISSMSDLASSNSTYCFYLLDNYQTIAKMYFLYHNIQDYFLRCYDQ